MADTQRMLERAGDRFEMPEPAMERMLRRREHRERNERIAAGAVGLAVSAAGIAGVLLTLRMAGATRPASGRGGATGAADTGGFVLPTVAIWIAIVVLGLTALAVVRLRARFQQVEDVDQEGRETGWAAASARRPAAEPGPAPRKGGSEMDSKGEAKVVGMPGAGIPEINLDDGKLRRTNRWLIGAVVVLALAVVALGVALIAQSGEGPSTTNPVPQARIDAIEGELAAINAHDMEGAVDGYFAPDAVFLAIQDTALGFTVETYTGRDEIIEALEGANASGDWTIEQVGDVIGLGDFTVGVARYHGTDWEGTIGPNYFRFDDDGKIVAQVAIGA